MARDPWWDIESRFDELRRQLRDFEPARAGGFMRRAPAVDVMDQGTEFVITADVPGVSKEEIDVEVDTRSVTISAHHATEEESGEAGYVRRERTSSAYERSLPLPEEVQPQEARAKYNNGVLTITLPKREPTAGERRRLTPE